MTELTPGRSDHGPQSSLRRVEAVLEAQGSRITRGPRATFGQCPVHDDSTPSMHVSWVSGLSGGMTLLYCQGCGARGPQLAEALGLTLADLYDEPLPERDRALRRVGKSPARRQAGRRRGKLGGLPAVLALAEPVVEPEHSWVEAARYPYVDLDGQLVQEGVRLECSSCPDRHKTFFQTYVSGRGERVKVKPDGFTPVLYRAPEVAGAVQAGTTVWLVEGEKDVHTAEALGLVATTNAGGGRGFPDELVEPLRGAHVVVVLDRDDTGWARGVELHAKLTAAGCAVELTVPSSTTPKSDLTDHVEQGHSLDDLVRVSVEEVQIWHELSPVKGRAKLVHQAVDQARARWALAEQNASPEDNRRYAVRWVKEAQCRIEALREMTDRLATQGLSASSSWVLEALGVAETLLNRAAEETRQCHFEVGVPLPPDLRPQPAPAITADGQDSEPSPSDGAGSEPSQMGVPGTGKQSIFRVLHGQIVQWEADRSPARRRQGEDDAEAEESGKLKTLLSMVVKVTAREYLEDAEDAEVEEPALMGRSTSTRPKVHAPRRLVAVRVEFADPVTGELMQLRVMAEQWDDHSWLKALPGNPDYDHKRAGLDQLQRAILAVSEDVCDEVLYQGTGWRRDPDGRHRYIHARGAITAGGHEDAPVAFDRVLSRYDLPDPTFDQELLRRAWLGASVTMLDRLPERVAAPLLGSVFRAALGHNPWVVSLIGSPGSFKTSVASKVMHHFGERWDHNKPATSASGNGDTFNAVRLKLHLAKDTLVWMDDFAPTKSWSEAQRFLEEIYRMVHNQEGRSRASRDGMSISDGTIPRASGLATSEVMPRPGSASERTLVVPLGRADVDRALLFPLDDPLSRHHRALVMSSFISWLAADLVGYRQHYRGLAEQYSERLIEAGETIRQSQAIASTYVGWVAMCDFLADREAITDEEREQTLLRVDEALRSAGRAAVDPDIPRTTGARVRELLSFALRQGLAYVDDVRDGECPPWPLAGRLGWRRTAGELDSMGNPTRYRLERCGMRLGYVLHDPTDRERGRVLMCDSTQLEAVLKAAVEKQAEKLEIDRGTACRALHEEGVLIPDDSEGRTRHTVKCNIYAEGRVTRMVALHLDKVLGDDHDEDPPSSPPNGSGGHDAGDGGGQVTEPSEPGAFTPQTLDEASVSDQGGSVATTQPASTEEAPVTLQHPPAAASQPAAPIPEAPAGPGATPTGGRAAKTAGATGPQFRAAAAVVGPEAIWLSNGETVPMPGAGPSHVGDLVRLAEWLNLGTQTTRYRAASGQVWITAELASKLGIDVDAISAAPERDRDTVCRQVTAGSPAVTEAVAAGYSLGGRDGTGLGRWTRVWKDNGRSVWMVLLPAMSTEDTAVPLLRGDPDPATLARRLGLLADALGQPYQLSGSTTGLDLMTALRWKDREQMFEVREPVPPAMQSNCEADLSWSRKPTDAEAALEWVHAYDRSGSYLAGVSGLELGVGAPTHHRDGTAFVPRLPGYWRIEIPEAGDWRLPHLLDPRGGNVGRLRWVTTPALEFAVEQGYDPKILEAYTWQQHARVLDPWYERIRDARTQLDTENPDAQIARDQLKAIYAPTIGMLGSHIHMDGRTGYAPERRHMIIAKARTNILRRVTRIGIDTDRWPLAIIADTVLYASDDPDPVTAWPGGGQWLGRELGRYKPEGSAPMAEHLPYLTGGPYKGKDAIVRISTPGGE